MPNSRTFKVSIQNKRTDIAGKKGTVPNTESPEDGNWLDTDLYDGQTLYNEADGVAYVRLGNTIYSWPLSIAAQTPLAVETFTAPIVDSRIVVPQAENLTLDELRRYYTIHVGGNEVMTSDQTTLENQVSGIINLGTSAYNDATAYIKRFALP